MMAAEAVDYFCIQSSRCKPIPQVFHGERSEGLWVCAGLKRPNEAIAWVFRRRVHVYEGNRVDLARAKFRAEFWSLRPEGPKPKASGSMHNA